MPDWTELVKPRKVLHQARTWADLSVIGLQFPVAIGLGYLWGWLMDEWFGTEPWLTALFTGFGIIAGFVNLFRMAAKIERDEAARGDQDADGDEG